MKIRNKNDVDHLDQKIQDELGIDIKSYRNEEVTESILELLSLPEFIKMWVLRPYGLILLAYICGFWWINLEGVEYLIYLIIGFPLFCSAGFFIALLFLIAKLRFIILSVMEYAVELFDRAALDVNRTNNRITPQNRTEVLGLLFAGIIHIVIIPVIVKAWKEAIPITGVLFGFCFKWILTGITNRFNLVDEEVQITMAQQDEGETPVTNFSLILSAISKSVNNLVGLTYKAARIPFLVFAVFSIGLLVVFLYLIN